MDYGYGLIKTVGYGGKTPTYKRGLRGQSAQYRINLYFIAKTDGGPNLKIYLIRIWKTISNEDKRTQQHERPVSDKHKRRAVTKVYFQIRLLS